MLFINRKKELNWLENRYDLSQKEGQLLILYGKRRVGKTALVREFLQNSSKNSLKKSLEKQDSIYYLANKTTTEEQLRSVTQVFARFFGDSFIKSDSFSDWREFFDYLGSKLGERNTPLVIVFDEFPYLVESNDGISSFFQYFWDEYGQNNKILMILMGSSISMMYEHALKKSAPLYGRRTGQWLLQPFSYKESKKFYPGEPFEKTFPIFALTGGIPAYAKQLEGNKSLKDNLADNVFPDGAFLSIEPELLLAEEFSDPRTFLTILKAIGLGRTRFSQIIQDTGLASTALPWYLKTLVELRLIKREIPVTESIPEKSKKSTYSLADSFLRFYFSFIFPNQSLIKNGEYEAVFEQHNEILQQLLAQAYEDATAEFVSEASKAGRLPHFEKLGRWWNKNTEIDLVGLNKSENKIVFVETKWRNQLIDGRVLHKLKQKSQSVVWGDDTRKEYFVLVSKSGFTDECRKIATKEGVVLIEMDSF